MRKSLPFLAFLSAITVLAQTAPKRIALTGKSDVPTAEKFLKGTEGMPEREHHE